MKCSRQPGAKRGHSFYLLLVFSLRYLVFTEFHISLVNFLIKSKNSFKYDTQNYLIQFHKHLWSVVTFRIESKVLLYEVQNRKRKAGDRTGLVGGGES